MTITVFGYLTLISTDFYDFISQFSPFFMFPLRRVVFDPFPKPDLKLVKNTTLRVVFSTLFSLFGNVVKHGLSSLIYRYMKKV